MSFRRISKTGLGMLAVIVSIIFLASCNKRMVTLSPTVVDVKVGETGTVTATVKEKGYPKTKVIVEFATEDENVATVDPSSAETNADGEAQATVTGVSQGSTKVTATYEGKSASAEITVSGGDLLPPTVTSVDPNSGDQGDTKSVTINGTDFQDGASSNFGADDITVNSTNFVSSTQLTANIAIAVGAALESRTVTVTNPDGKSGSLANAFTVVHVPVTHMVTMEGFEFVPAALAIKAGDIVIWTHKQPAVAHTVTSGLKNADDAGDKFDSRPTDDPGARMQNGDTFSHTFNIEIGTFQYHCVVHGAAVGGNPSGMVGTITVTEPLTIK